MTGSAPTSTRIATLLEDLADGVARLTTSVEWQRYLDFQSRFHRYSYANALLIAAQFPEATQVAGYSTWRRVHRVVRRGERAIWILAPIRRRATGAHDEESTERVAGFRPVAVFDLSQTEGRTLPEPFARLEGEDPSGAYLRLGLVADSLGFDVEEARLTGGSNGDCSHSRRRIRVEERNGPAQKAKTLAHELAHVLLHERFESRALAEAEAESAAYVVCAALGIDSGEYSFGYLATWAGGGNDAITAIRGSCARIQRAARSILGQIGPAEPEGTVEDLVPIPRGCPSRTRHVMVSAAVETALLATT